MTNQRNPMSKLLERLALRFSTAKVRECVRSLTAGKDDWRFTDKEAHRTRPYPMGFYADDPRIYWAIGWGMSEHMFPWERWIVRKAKARASTEGTDND